MFYLGFTGVVAAFVLIPIELYLEKDNPEEALVQLKDPAYFT